MHPPMHMHLCSAGLALLPATSAALAALALASGGVQVHGEVAAALRGEEATLRLRAGSAHRALGAGPEAHMELEGARQLVEAGVASSSGAPSLAEVRARAIAL